MGTQINHGHPDDVHDPGAVTEIIKVTLRREAMRGDTLELTRSRPLARPSPGLLLRKIPFAVSQTAQVPGANPLKDAHASLDTAVLAAYGFSAKKDLLAQLLALNQAVAAKIEKGEPVTAPGVSRNYPDAKQLVTDDCIRPST